ncbi:MAG: endonuclease/exonuclease/phosphatase family protein [Rhodospirillales bacterium]|nr:endonuclease/exonuclease/phosphatase family protein [Rhodospirillales bacterium]
MKIVTYNMQFGLGKDEHFDLERIASEVEGTDIICLQEVERHWQRSGNVDQPAEMGKLLDKYYWIYGPYFDVDASTAQPDGTIKNVRRQFGNMILSKTPIISSRLFPMPKSPLQQRHNMCVGVLEGVIKLPNDGALRIYNVHLGARSQSDRVAQIISIKEIIRRAPLEGGTWTGQHYHPLWKENAAPPPMPVEFVLLGDFNLEAKDPEYDHLAGPLEEGAGRLTCKDNYIDTWVATGHGENEGSTFLYDPGASDSQGMRIDFAFVDQTMEKRVRGARIDGAAQGSDHQPYWIDLQD